MGEALKKAEEDKKEKAKEEAHQKKIWADRLAKLLERLKEEADNLPAKLEAEQATKREEALKKKEEEEKEKAKEEAHEKKTEADRLPELAGESSPGPTGGCSNCINILKCENSKCICQSGWTGEAMQKLRLQHNTQQRLRQYQF